MLTTFTDRLVVSPSAPQRQAIGAGSSAGDRRMSALVIGQNANDDSRHMIQVQDQVTHHRLWNYVAVDRIAAKMSECVPHVGRRRSPSGNSNQAAQLSWRELQHLRRCYAVPDSMDVTPVGEGHPLVRLLRSVNSEDWWGSFFYELVLFWEHTGEAWIWVIPDATTGLPAEMWVIPTQWVFPEYDVRKKRLLHWLVRPDGDKRREMKLPLDEVVCIKSKNLLSKTRGWSPNRAGAEWIYNSEQVEQSRASSLKYGPNPGVTLTLDPEHYEGVSSEDISAVGNKFVARYSGSDKTGRPMVIPPGVKVDRWTLTPQELDYQSSTDAVRDAVLALRGVPKAIAGVSHDLNKASIFGANLIFCESTITPKLRYIAGALTEKLAVKFGPDLMIWFDDCRPQDDEAEREEIKLDWELGALTPDERRAIRNREPLGTEASRSTYVGSSLRTLDTAAASEPFQNRKDTGSSDNADQTNTGSSSGVNAQWLETPAAWTQHITINGPAGSVTEQPGQQHDAAESASGESSELQQSSDLPRVTQADEPDPEKRARRISGIFSKLHKQIENAANEDLRKFWQGVSDRTKKLFSDLEDDDGFQFPSPEEATPAAEFESGFNSAMRPHWESGAETGALFERDMLRLQPGFPDDLPDISVEISPEMRREIDRFIATKEEGVWKQVLGTTREQLEATIADGIEAGEGAKDIAKRIEATLDTSKERSLMIARTEATGAMNAGQEMQRNEDGVPYKQWISTLDSRTRETHLAADQQQVESGEAFSVGGYQMRFPGDGSLGAPAEEIVNCRCTSVGSFELPES